MRQFASIPDRHGITPCTRVEETLNDESGDEGPEFTEEEVVRLHWWLLQKVRLLSNENTPLADKFEIVRWVFTDPVRDTRPFSFVNCLRVVSCSPLSHLPFLGSLDPQEVRDWIGARLRHWIEATLQQYPDWVRQEVMANPEWVAECLARNPQWLNEEVRRHSVRQDLFS
ncbi:hypothetical protein [Massilia sp. BJB1822]|uniref:hypothetical protein n=1 Tax=Massilia sp. BJB1822 TaxID=2744470 RepID=UPI00159482BB|nr:hypothetical protein [Massilia sp. BJB1822]NVD97675.1 hypothetical protein [Massilia sp. BJB1822]